MKHLKSWIIAFSIVTIIAIAFYLNDNNSTFRKSQIEFAVHNAKDVQSIVIIQHSDTFKIENVSGSWVYNNLSVARKDALINLFRLLSNIKVKAPERGYFDDILRNGTLVSIYSKEKLIKQYIIAEDTVKRKSIAQLTGSDKVFEVEVTGYPPRILPFYRIDKKWWRDKSILRQNPEQIVSISVENKKNSANSYTILNYGKGRYGVKQGKSDQLLANVAVDHLIQYLSTFTNVEIAEYIESDSVELFTPLKNLEYSLKIKNISGDRYTIDAYFKPNDPNQLYLLINNSQLALGKYVVFDLLFRDPSFFCK